MNLCSLIVRNMKHRTVKTKTIKIIYKFMDEKPLKAWWRASASWAGEVWWWRTRVAIGLLLLLNLFLLSQTMSVWCENAHSSHPNL